MLFISSKNIFKKFFIQTRNEKNFFPALVSCERWGFKEFGQKPLNPLRISMDFYVFGSENKQTLSGPYFKARDPIDLSPKNPSTPRGSLLGK